MHHAAAKRELRRRACDFASIESCGKDTKPDHCSRSSNKQGKGWTKLQVSIRARYGAILGQDCRLRVQTLALVLVEELKYMKHHTWYMPFLFRNLSKLVQRDTQCSSLAVAFGIA